MTFNKLSTAIELAREEPGSRIYRYTTLWGRVVYAMFPRPEWDDMAQAPYAKEYELLYDAGSWTIAGEAQKTLHESEQL